MSRTLKVLIIGDGNAGKTSLRARYLTGKFQTAYRATIGADFVSRTVEVNVPVPGAEHRRRKSKDDRVTGTSKQGGPSRATYGRATANEPDENSSDDEEYRHPSETMRITLSMWDTAGQERFRSLGTAFYRGADAVVIAFDVNRKGSLERCLSWYQDFCKMGDLGAEDGPHLEAQRARALREERRRFCWVAVGCKADLLAHSEASSDSTHISAGAENDADEQPFSGTRWTDARSYFDELVPRYLPPSQTETNLFERKTKAAAPGSPEHEAAKPYNIGTEVPARPEDVLSRPSPRKSTPLSKPHAKLDMPLQTAATPESSRHPHAGPAPGEAVAESTIRTSSKPRQRRLSKAPGKDSIRSIDVWQGDAESQDLSVRRDTQHRSRYDSTLSVGASSVYYSIRGGSALLSQSPSRADSSVAESLDSTPLTEVAHHRTANASSRSSHTVAQSGTFQDKKRNTLSSSVPKGSGNKAGGKEDDTQRRQGISGELDSYGSSSTKTVRNGATTPKRDSSDEAGDASESSAVVVTVPSGEPIPFPSGDDEADERSVDVDETAEAHRRRLKRISRLSVAHSTHAVKDGSDGDKARSRKASMIAQHVKADQEAQEEEAQQDSEQVDVDNRRATLYSARPSSCASTIRAADDFPDVNERPEALDTSATAAAAVEADISSSAPSSVHDSAYKIDEGEMYEARHMEQGFRLFYTSAKDGVGIDDVFTHIARRVAMRWAYDEWDEARRRRTWGYTPDGEVRTAPPTDEDRERERMRRAIRVSTGKGTGDCCW